MKGYRNALSYSMGLYVRVYTIKKEGVRVHQTKRRLIVLLLVVSMILSSIRFDYVGDVFAADAETTSDTVTVGTPSEAEEAEAILEGEEAAVRIRLN